MAPEGHECAEFAAPRGRAKLAVRCRDVAAAALHSTTLDRFTAGACDLRAARLSHTKAAAKPSAAVMSARPLAHIILACCVVVAASALQLSARPRLQQRAGSRKCGAEVFLPAEVPRAAIRAATRMQDDDGPSSFAEYLVPYALAVVAALLATSAFFAFLNGAI